MEGVKKDDGEGDGYEEVKVAALKQKVGAGAKLGSLQGRTTGPARRSTKGGWTEQEDEMLRRAVKAFNGKNWKKIAERFPGRSDVQCLHRWQKVLNPDLIKGPWTKEEDDRIIEMVNQHGSKKWSVIAQSLPGRIGKQCRERWHNHLNPAIKKHAWTKEEEVALIRAHQMFGNKWAEIAKYLPGRADNSIKNHWNCSVKKKLDTYLASGFGGDHLGINSQDFDNHGVKEETMNVNVSTSDPGVVTSLDQEEDSDDGVDISLGVSALGMSNEKQTDLLSYPEPGIVKNCCLKGETHFRKKSSPGIRFVFRGSRPSSLTSEVGVEDANYNRPSDSLKCSVAKTEKHGGISSCESMMTMPSLENTFETVLSTKSCRPAGEVSLLLSTSGDPLDGTSRRTCLSPHMAVSVTTERIPESPKRPRHIASLHGPGGMKSKLNRKCNTRSPTFASDFGMENGQVCSKNRISITTPQPEDHSFGPLFYEPPKQTNVDVSLKIGMSAEKNLQQASSPVCCCTPPRCIGSISASSPETILRSAAKSFKSTPSIIRKRSRGTLKEYCNIHGSTDVCMSEVKSGGSNDSQKSTHSYDQAVAVQDDLINTNLLNVKWLSLYSPSLNAETDVSLKSVEKRLEYAFDLEWDGSKAKHSDPATENDQNDDSLVAADNLLDFSRVRSDQNGMLRDIGVNCNPVSYR